MIYIMLSFEHSHSGLFRLQIFLSTIIIVMSVMLLLIIASLLVAGGFLVALFWSVNDGQFDDDITPSIRILNDQQPPPQT
jgi:cbb3-type cytochrome oxidase maturation protein